MKGQWLHDGIFIVQTTVIFLEEQESELATACERRSQPMVPPTLSSSLKDSTMKDSITSCTFLLFFMLIAAGRRLLRKCTTI
jgi:hypothetical protein